MDEKVKFTRPNEIADLQDSDALVREWQTKRAMATVRDGLAMEKQKGNGGVSSVIQWKMKVA